MGETPWQDRRKYRLPLHYSLFRAMRRHPFRMAFADSARPRVSAAEALAATVILARRLAGFWADQELVGILLPPSVGGALVNHAASLSGRISVNLNYTTSLRGLEAAARQANLKTVVTSRRFVEKAGLELPESLGILWLEDVMSAVGRLERLRALALGLLAPVPVLERRFAGKRVSIDEPVTVIFSSGSTDDPKGIVLTHDNIDANSRSVAQVLLLSGRDRLLGILPFFHSFGYIALWICANRGVGIVFHPTPLEPVAIGNLVRRYRITLMIATPTFLQLYLRRCKPEQFASLVTVITGGEKLPVEVAQAFEQRFGVQPMEGYGTTECSPAVALNTPGSQGLRRGSVGKPLPGVAVKIVDPDTFESVPGGMQGMLLVKGSNVMRGYLGRDDLTAQVMRDGWYVTGDIARLDADGYLEITDRISRFSKIGGEMVPHREVEEALGQAAGAESQAFAVTGVPDARRGEALAVLHTVAEASIPAVLEKVSAGGLPNLYVPRFDHFVRVDSLPFLGTGKLDLRGVRRIAMETLCKKGAQS